MSTLVTTALRHNASASNNMVLDSSGNVALTGTLRARNANYTFTLPNAGGASNWIFLGTFTAPQTGHHVHIKVVTSTGYNADITQQSEIHIHFKTSNGISVDGNGFAGDATFYVTNANAGPPFVVKVRGNAAGVSATSYDVFLQQSAFNGDGSFYTVELGNQFTSSWTNSSTISTDPGVASSTVAIATQRFLVQSNMGVNGLFQFNNGYGSVATAFGCRAWVNFNGTGTVAIRGSGNVSSISDNGTGDYTVNFTTAMPDANYAATQMIMSTNTNGAGWAANMRSDVSPTTSALRFLTGVGNALPIDVAQVHVSIFR